MTALNLKQWSFFRGMTDDELISYARTSAPEEAQEICAVMIERFAHRADDVSEAKKEVEQVSDYASDLEDELDTLKEKIEQLEKDTQEDD